MYSIESILLVAINKQKMGDNKKIDVFFSLKKKLFQPNVFFFHFILIITIFYIKFVLSFSQQSKERFLEQLAYFVEGNLIKMSLLRTQVSM